MVSNLYNYKIINKTNDTLNIRFRTDEESLTIKLVGEMTQVLPQAANEGALFLEYPGNLITSLKTEFSIGVYNEDRLIEEVETNFLGPVNK
jgi:hypothetical protein